MSNNEKHSDVTHLKCHRNTLLCCAERDPVRLKSTSINKNKAVKGNTHTILFKNVILATQYLLLQVRATQTCFL